jgi:hypothetical protein
MTETVQSERRTFTFPHEVVDDPALGTSQKRAILSEWASDAYAVESFPVLRLLPGTRFPVTFSSIMDARAYLDRKFQEDESQVAPGDCVLAAFKKRKTRSDGGADGLRT